MLHVSIADPLCLHSVALCACTEMIAYCATAAAAAGYEHGSAARHVPSAAELPADACADQ
jgi:hypothetical protein